MTTSISIYSRENGGRVLLLFLLFLLAIYQFITAGFNAYAIICIIPLLVLGAIAVFKWRMSAFWLLIFINYFVQWKEVPPSGLPMSLPSEMLQLLLLGIAIIDARQTPHFERCANLMFYALTIWCGFCTLEVLNDTCGLGINVGAWYTGARMLAFQVMYIFLVFSIYISSPEILMRYLKVWACLSLFSALWTFKQQYIGFTTAEAHFLQGSRTHIIQGGTLIRYFSTFSDASNYLIFGITTKFNKLRWFFLIVGVLMIIAMFASGTRTAIFCMAGGFVVFLFLSKSVKIIVPSAIIGSFFFFILAFTNIGQGNQQIRRMRSAFNRNDASTNVRSINQETMRKYMQDAPWGIGLGMGYDNVPANNKYNRMATIASDSEYVFIWLRTGRIGITTFIITMLIMLGGACRIVLFKLKNPTLIGIGGGLCSAFVAIQLGGYANQVLMQFPNCLIFYGGLTIVFILPYLEPEWIKYEQEILAKQEERKRLKLEKKLASRV